MPGLKIEPGPTRPGITAADIAAIKEVVRRKAAGFWAEGTTRTTVRKFAHDCIPTGPPVSSQPHALKGEAAQDRLEEEVQRGQLVRGPSDHIAEVFTSRMREIAERKEAKEARKQAALAAIQASLLVGGWLCPGCNEWNLSFRNLCYRCNGKRTAAGVLSRGIPDPTRDQQDRDESDSDDSAAIELRREQEEDLEETVKPFLRSTRTKRGSGSKKRTNPPGGAQSKGKFPKGRGTGRGAGAWLGVGVVAATCRGAGLVRGPAPLRLPPRPVGRAAPFGFAATRRNRSGYVAEPVLAAASYTWALTRRVLNRLAHICTGNISAWAGVAAAVAAPVRRDSRCGCSAVR